MRKRIYIAGPISYGDLAENIRQATGAGLALIRAGFAPLVPHLTCYMGGPTPEVLPRETTRQDWLATDLPWVVASDALLRLPGFSKGADCEVSCANDHGIPVFFSLDDLLRTMIP